MKNIKIISKYGERFNQLHAAQRQLLRPPVYFNNAIKIQNIEFSYNPIFFKLKWQFSGGKDI